MAAFAPVGVVAYGVSTPYSYWGFALLQAIVEAVAGPTSRLHVASLAALRDGFAARAGGGIVVTSDFPDADLAAFVSQSGLPLIMFADDPDVLIDWTMRSRHLSPENAARFGSRICSALAPHVAAAAKLTLDGARPLSPRRVVAEIVEFLWPGRGERLTPQLCDYLDTQGALAPLAPYAVQASDDDAALENARAAFSGYGDLLSGRWPNAILWPLSLFTRPDARPWGDPFDLTGPARVVLFGPYMHLPVGDWAARVEFEIDGALSGVEALTDVRINEVVSEKTFVMPAKGIFAYELRFRVADPHHPVEIRLFIKKSAIEGVFLPRSVRVTPALPSNF